MQRKIIVVLCVTTTLLLVAIVFVRKSHKADEIKTYLQDGVGINDYYVKETQKRWGANPIELAGNPSLAQIIRNVIRVETAAAIDPTVIEKLQSSILDFLEAYSNGQFDVIKNYRLKQTLLINPDFISKQVERAKDSLQSMKKSIATPLFSKPSRLAEPRLVKWTDGSDRLLGELYTNRIKFSLVNEIATQAYKGVGEKTIAKSSGSTILALVDRDVSRRLQEIESSPNFYDFITPWEKLSSQMITVHLFDTNRIPNGFSLNSGLLGGLHRDIEGAFGYDPGPDEIINEHGAVRLAVFQTAVKPRGLNYYGPVTAIFFYDPKNNTWHLYQFVCHAQIAPSVPF